MTSAMTAPPFAVRGKGCLCHGGRPMGRQPIISDKEIHEIINKMAELALAKSDDTITVVCNGGKTQMKHFEKKFYNALKKDIVKKKCSHQVLIDAIATAKKYVTFITKKDHLGMRDGKLADKPTPKPKPVERPKPRLVPAPAPAPAKPKGPEVAEVVLSEADGDIFTLTCELRSLLQAAGLETLCLNASNPTVKLTAAAP